MEWIYGAGKVTVEVRNHIRRHRRHQSGMLTSRVRKIRRQRRMTTINRPRIKGSNEHHNAQPPRTPHDSMYRKLMFEKFDFGPSGQRSKKISTRLRGA